MYYGSLKFNEIPEIGFAHHYYTENYLQKRYSKNHNSIEIVYVNEGEYIRQGQQIAEVGATGNVTGPHLHFEIKRNNQYVDPDLILQF